MKPSIGRIVHYVLSAADTERMQTKSRPGIVVCLGTEPGTVNMQVFTNGGHDDLPPLYWKRDVPHDEEKKPGTWHWPPIVERPVLAEKPAESLDELKKQLEASRTQEAAADIEKKIEEKETSPFPIDEEKSDVLKGLDFSRENINRLAFSEPSKKDK